MPLLHFVVTPRGEPEPNQVSVGGRCYAVLVSEAACVEGAEGGGGGAIVTFHLGGRGVVFVTFRRLSLFPFPSLPHSLFLEEGGR